MRLVPDQPDRQRLLVILDRRRRRVAEAYLDAARARGFDVRSADDLSAALGEIGAAGALEVLVEAGLALTNAVLDGGLWDEHGLIEQGAGPSGADRVTIRRNTAPHITEKDEDVLRHH